MKGGVFALACLLLAAAGQATAHGPTVEITAAGFKPVLLNLFEGTTVHFTNTLAAPQGLVVSGESGTVTSPPLDAAGEGWHYTFERGGAYAIHLVQRPEATMQIVVVKKAAP
jgi:plastocyanin